MQEIKVNNNEAGQRLDKFLFKFFKEAPNSFVYKMLRKKNIVLNDKKSSGKEILNLNDCIKIYMRDETISKFRGESTFVKVNYDDLNIIYDDEDVVFVNKPAGVLSQKSNDNDVSLNEMIISYMLDNGLTQEQLHTFKPSICNRLDRNTSGLVTAGKSLKGLQELSRLFKERLVHKYYIAVVEGEVTDGLEIEGYLSKNSQTNKVTITKEPTADASYIKTSYSVIKSTKDYSVLRVLLVTGKTHQIRAHLASIGHPILGDYKYGYKENSLFNVDRTLLHSYELTFEDTLIKQLCNKSFIAQYPSDIAKFVE